MISFPNAKINIGLNILRKREDGYHEIESVFYPIELCDILEIVENPSGSHMAAFHNTGILIDVPKEKNLCLKAYHLLQKDFKLPEGSIHLHKIIPLEAGLGGGSSDAAFTINILDNLFSLGLSDEKKIYYASLLGSDCAFFIRNKPSLASGRGEILKEIELDLTGLYIAVVKPSFSISTSEAYSGVRPGLPGCRLTENMKLPVEQWKGNITNDFENHIFLKHPDLAQIKEKLYLSGAVYASMSGSGSAIYGIFKEKMNVDEIFPDYFIWTGIL
jgi:4-diphosphocytidyl-2-C-methyl-D-erythritol kinase